MCLGGLWCKKEMDGYTLDFNCSLALSTSKEKKKEKNLFFLKEKDWSVKQI